MLVTYVDSGVEFLLLPLRVYCFFYCLPYFLFCPSGLVIQCFLSFLIINIQRGTCIKGLFWPPFEPKTENCFSPISFDWFIRRIPKVECPGFYFTFTVAVVTKMVDEIGLK